MFKFLKNIVLGLTKDKNNNKQIKSELRVSKGKNSSNLKSRD